MLINSRKQPCLHIKHKNMHKSQLCYQTNRRRLKTNLQSHGDKSREITVSFIFFNLAIIYLELRSHSLTIKHQS